MPHDPFAKPLNPRSSSLIVRVILAWTLVGVPLAWGVWQVFVKSLDLFK